MRAIKRVQIQFVHKWDAEIMWNGYCTYVARVTVHMLITQLALVAHTHTHSHTHTHENT